MVVGEEFLLAPLPCHESQVRPKRLRELEAEDVTELRQRAALQMPSKVRGRFFIPQLSKATREATWTATATSLDEWCDGGIEEC